MATNVRFFKIKHFDNYETDFKDKSISDIVGNNNFYEEAFYLNSNDGSLYLGNQKLSNVQEVQQLIENFEQLYDFQREITTTNTDGTVTTETIDYSDIDKGKAIRTIAIEELSYQLLSDKAEADFKTLQELGAWIEDHPENVAEMNLAIQNNAKDIDDIQLDIMRLDVQPDWDLENDQSHAYIKNKIPIKNGIGENSIVIGDGEALSSHSIASGVNSLSGAKAYTIVAVNKDAKTYTLDSVDGLEVGDIYSVHILYTDGTSAQSENYGKITKINNTIITVDNLYCTKEFSTSSSYIDENGIDTERNIFRIIDKPNVGNRVVGAHSYSEGYQTQALSKNAHAEGNENIAYGSHSHAEGSGNKAGYCSHAEGRNNEAIGQISHAEGRNNIASGTYSHVEGAYNEATASQAHAEGANTKAYGTNAHTEGYNTQAIGVQAHAEGGSTIAQGSNSHAEGNGSKALGPATHAEGIRTQARISGSHTEGMQTVSLGENAHAEGKGTNIVPDTITVDSTNDDVISSYGSKKFSLAKGKQSHIEGLDNLALGDNSHAEGVYNKSIGLQSHTEGANNTASGSNAHAEGDGTKATGNNTHSEGWATEATGVQAHAEGSQSKAYGSNTHAEGVNTIARGPASHVQGKYNIEDTESKYAHIIGGGTSTVRKNIHTVDWSGNAWYAGSIKIGGTSYDDALEIALKSDFTTLNNSITTINNNITALEKTTSNLSTKIDTNTSNISNLSTKIDTNTSNISSLSTKVNTNTSNISSLTTKVNTNTSNISSLTTKVNNMVDLSSTQTITGVKTFNNSIKIGNATLTYDATGKFLVINVS